MNAHKLLDNLKSIIIQTEGSSSEDALFKGKSKREFISYLYSLKTKVEKSIKFDISDMDYEYSCELKKLPRLPFQCAYFETVFEGGILGCLASEADGVLELDLVRSITGEFIPIGSTILYSESSNGIEKVIDSNESVGSEIEMYSYADGFLKCIEAINCSNVVYNLVNAPKLINSKREKKGKVKLFDFHTLHIETEQKIQNKNGAGTHASPRLHLRRGHVRVLKSGKTIWIQPCLVGDKEKGFVHKDYSVH